MIMIYSLCKMCDDRFTTARVTAVARDRGTGTSRWNQTMRLLQMVPMSIALSTIAYVDDVSQNSTRYFTWPRPYSLKGMHLFSNVSIKKRRQSKSFGTRCGIFLSL